MQGPVLRLAVESLRLHEYLMHEAVRGEIVVVEPNELVLEEFDFVPIFLYHCDGIHGLNF